MKNYNCYWVIAPMCFFLAFKKANQWHPMTGCQPLFKVISDSNPNPIPRFLSLEGRVDSEPFNMYLSENIVSDGAYFNGIIVSKHTGIPQRIGGTLYFKGNRDQSCNNILAAKKLRASPIMRIVKRTFSFGVHQFGKKKQDLILSGTFEDSGHFQCEMPSTNPSFPVEANRIGSLQKKKDSFGFTMTPRLIIAQNSDCGVGKAGWEDLMRFNFIEFNGSNFRNDVFLQTYCSGFKRPYASYLLDYRNLTDVEERNIDFGSTVYTHVSYLDSLFVSGFFENHYVNLEKGLNESVPYLYSIKANRNLYLSDILQKEKREMAIHKIFRVAQQSEGIGNCLVQEAQIAESRLFMTFNSIHFLFCPTNRSNNGFQGLLVSVPFEQIKECLTTDFKKAMHIQ